MSRSTFPRLSIRSSGLQARGAFAEAQAEFLDPDPATVAALDALLAARAAGVVAHFYMDPELQGVLTACAWPHVRISDSLAMADAAIEMVRAGARRVVVLGVDFMSENVRAMLDASGHEEVPVYRVATGPIGCSLAESAEDDAYTRWLHGAARVPRSLHVVYINTSLRTKAVSHSLVPTITCTSSNVVRTVLQAAAQIEDVHVWYGPDTYMGRNLRDMLATYADLDDASIRALHPAHDRESLRALLRRFHYYEHGICVVHHLFGAEVVRRIRRDHPDAYVTAHLEVPGEMFALGLEAARAGRGVVGSTSDILAFIDARVRQATTGDRDRTLSFVLGTESGMITSIVRAVRERLARGQSASGPEIEVEILFPVASEAITATGDAALPLVPGPPAGEGCSAEGGCATCPYMKLNSLDALFGLLERLGSDDEAALAPYFPRTYPELIAGRTAAALGGEPILHMRHFQREGSLPGALVRDVIAGRNGADGADPGTTRDAARVARGE